MYYFFITSVCSDLFFTKVKRDGCTACWEGHVYEVWVTTFIVQDGLDSKTNQWVDSYLLNRAEVVELRIVNGATRYSYHNKKCVKIRHIAALSRAMLWNQTATLLRIKIINAWRSVWSITKQIYSNISLQTETLLLTKIYDRKYSTGSGELLTTLITASLSDLKQQQQASDSLNSKLRLNTVKDWFYRRLQMASFLCPEQ